MTSVPTSSPEDPFATTSAAPYDPFASPAQPVDPFASSAASPDPFTTTPAAPPAPPFEDPFASPAAPAPVPTQGETPLVNRIMAARIEATIKDVERKGVERQQHLQQHDPTASQEPISATQMEQLFSPPSAQPADPFSPPATSDQQDN